MQTAKISEIFQSIQGEGKYAGVRQVFLRFFGCHMHCSWCDTPDSIGDTTKKFHALTLNEVFDQVRGLYRDCHSVSLTGGEPLLQAEFLQELLPLLRKAKMKAYLETSGVLHNKLRTVIKDIDIISMDIKMPSSTGERPFWKEHAEFLKMAKTAKKDVYLKAVVTAKTEKADILKAVSLVQKIDPRLLFILQPNSFELTDGVVAKCEEFQRLCFKALPNTRVIPQMHKFMQIR